MQHSLALLLLLVSTKSRLLAHHALVHLTDRPKPSALAAFTTTRQHLSLGVWPSMLPRVTAVETGPGATHYEIL